MIEGKITIIGSIIVVGLAMYAAVMMLKSLFGKLETTTTQKRKKQNKKKEENNKIRGTTTITHQSKKEKRKEKEKEEEETEQQQQEDPLKDPPNVPTIKFVQKALAKNKLIDETKRVVRGIKLKKLQGGCHYTVYKVKVDYDDNETEKQQKEMKQQIEALQKEIGEQQEREIQNRTKQQTTTKTTTTKTTTKKKKKKKHDQEYNDIIHTTTFKKTIQQKLTQQEEEEEEQKMVQPIMTSPTSVYEPITIKEEEEVAGTPSQQQRTKKKKTTTTTTTTTTLGGGNTMKKNKQKEEKRQEHEKILKEISKQQQHKLLKLKELKDAYYVRNAVQIDRMMEKTSTTTEEEELMMEPPTIIIKYLEWGDMSYFDRFKLYCRQVLSHHNKMSMYFQSYQIESLFYLKVRGEVERQYNELKSVGIQQIHGLKVPEVYYNFADRLNMRFVMIMQDIRWDRSRMKTGQGMGFSMKQASYCLASLAKFHASCSNHPMLQNINPVWDLGGYWTGLKRSKDKKHIKAWYAKAAKQFEGHLKFPPSLGDRLERHLDRIMQHVNDLPRSTFVHGDFKITNIFVNKKKNVWTIDWQWLGRGVGAIDVAYFMLTSMRADTMKYAHVYELVKNVYYPHFACSVTNYPFERIWDDIAMCMVDFFIYVVVSKWAFMTPHDVESYAAQKKDGLHLQRYDNMQKMIKLAAAMMNHLQLH